MVQRGQGNIPRTGLTARLIFRRFQRSSFGKCLALMTCRTSHRSCACSLVDIFPWFKNIKNFPLTILILRNHTMKYANKYSKNIDRTQPECLLASFSAYFQDEVSYKCCQPYWSLQYISRHISGRKNIIQSMNFQYKERLMP